jgi:hypothetical protein
MEKTIVLGECKWQTKLVEQGVLRGLVDKTGQIVPKQGQWRVLYLGFARAGWTNSAQAFAGSASVRAVPASANWEPAGMVLLDLSQVDADLHHWVRRE